MGDITRQLLQVARRFDASTNHASVPKRTALAASGRYARGMTQDPKSPGQPRASDLSTAGYGHQVHGSRKGLGGDQPNGPRRTVALAGSADWTMRPQALSEDVIPTCPLCHTASSGVTPHALSEGAYWRCTRCGQMWDAVRLQTAANYARQVQA